MLLQPFLFYIFAALTVLSAVLVISVKNPVHSVLFLIFAFFNAAGIFILLGAEFLAMILVIVYVGAVAVLFLFVVLMLDINMTAMRQGFLKYLPLGIVIIAFLFAELFLIIKYSLAINMEQLSAALPILANKEVTNTHAIGNVLYTNYLYPFEISGLVLLVAMIGSIVLTLRHRQGVRKQNISRQVARNRSDCIEIVTVKTGAGIDGNDR
jgi:NADH-quinone oxidoreductase subunit J